MVKYDVPGSGDFTLYDIFFLVGVFIFMFALLLLSIRGVLADDDQLAVLIAGDDQLQIYQVTSADEGTAPAQEPPAAPGGGAGPVFPLSVMPAQPIGVVMTDLGANLARIGRELLQSPAGLVVIFAFVLLLFALLVLLRKMKQKEKASLEVVE